MLQCPMIAALLLSLLLAQANDFVRFDICYLDLRADPWKFISHPEGHWAKIRADTVGGLTDARLGYSQEVSGIECTRLYTADGTFFVVGSVKQVCQRLGGKDCE